MNVAAILKLKGREVFTTAPDTTLLDIAKLLGMHGIGCIVVTGAGRQGRRHRVGARYRARDRTRRIEGAEGAGRDLHDQDRGDLPRSPTPSIG